MPDEKLFEQSIRDLIFDLCAVLQRYGYNEVSVGALMRVMGVSEEHAQKHDCETFEITSQMSQTPIPPDPPPPGTTLH